MKPTEKVPENTGQGSPLPRFLRGLFGGQGNPPVASPSVAKPVSAPPKLEAASVPAEPEPESAPVFAGMERRPKILVVDDDPVVLKTMEIKLSRAGCQVVLGHDGPEAINTARTAEPDVIVLDIGLPSDVTVAWDGIRVMQWIQRLKKGEMPPVIIIMGSNSPELRQSALDQGAVAFFQKPVDHDQLVAAIRDVLEKAGLLVAEGQSPAGAAR